MGSELGAWATACVEEEWRSGGGEGSDGMEEREEDRSDRTGAMAAGSGRDPCSPTVGDIWAVGLS